MKNYELIKLNIQFLLRDDNGIYIPMDSQKDLKNFSFKIYNEILDEIIEKCSNDIKQALFEELTSSLYFNEFMIKIFNEKYDLFIASISFEYKNKLYYFSDLICDYFDWIDKECPRILIDEEFSRIEMDIYQFDEYDRYIGLDKENFTFTIHNKN